MYCKSLTDGKLEERIPLGKTSPIAPCGYLFQAQAKGTLRAEVYGIWTTYNGFVYWSCKPKLE